MKTLQEITERLEMILCEEYSPSKLNTFVGFNCDFQTDELENGTSTIQDVANYIFNRQL